MDESAALLAPISVAGLCVSLDADLLCASLRYHDSNGPVADRVRSLLNQPLPAPLAAGQSNTTQEGAAVTLAWRSPTETLVLCRSRSVLAGIRSDAEYWQEGCYIEQTGGYRAIRLTGARTPDLFSRLGAPQSVPAVGQALRSRLAEVPVLALSLVPGEYLLLVERIYAPHLFDWMRESALDLDAVGTPT